MKRTHSKNKNKVINENQKISNFFKKLPQKNNLKADGDVLVIDEDIIPGTPNVNSSKSKPVLSPITNVEEGAPRKRKCSPNNSSTEKSTKRKNENTDPCSSRKNRTPEKLNRSFQKSNETPQTPNRTLDEVVSSPTLFRSSSEKSLRKLTPHKSHTPKKKLFESSLDVADFKVEIINNFLKITPSKSSEKSSSTPHKSSEKDQNSILNCISPSLSSRVSRVQSENETTPIKSPSKPHIPGSSKVKMKLAFEQLETQIVTGSEKQVNDKKPHLLIDTIEFFDDSSWDNLNLSQELYNLDLNTSQHCKIISYNILDRKAAEIIVQSTKNGAKAKCILEGFWISTKMETGASIYLQAVRIDETWKVTNSDGLLVYEPDLLISSTSVVGALFCKRRSIFKDRFYGFEPQNKAMIVGILVHTLLQNALKSKADSIAKIETILKALLTMKDMNRMLYDASLKLEEIKDDMLAFVPRLVEFMKTYVTGSNKNRVKKHDNWNGSIDSIQDIEENIWCTELGMKGKVDVSLSVGDKVMPLELKTGRATVSLEHRGQVMIYIMMMLKLGYKVSSGLLLYLKDGTLREIPYNECEKRDIILLRNELAYYLNQKTKIKKADENDANEDLPLQTPELPDPIQHHSACGKCPYNIVCCAYLRHEKNDLSDNKYLKAVSDDIMSHLSESHIQYFIHWTNLIDLESSYTIGKDSSAIYTATPEQRENLGRCLTWLKISDCNENGNGLYNHTFKKANPKNALTFYVSGLGQSSYVVVSTDTRPAVSSGLVSFIDHDSIIVGLERNLQEKYPNASFHLDTYDSNNVNSFNLANLSILLEQTERAHQLRNLIVDKAEPKFLKKLPRIVANKAPSILKHLNNVQQRAVLRILTAEDYVLIKGMPGTGKTATIVALVELLIEIGQTVLITSYTHNAIDNVCLRLKKQGIKVLRLGSQGRIHSDLQDISEYELTKNCKTVEDLEKVYNDANILAVTCLGTKHPIFCKRSLDVCIVDESTQALQCSMLRALSVCKKFVLIGDPDQLPPLVRNKDANVRGMSESLFEHLENEVGKVVLNINYRMNTTITNLANQFMYNGELKIGNEKVANTCLTFTKSIQEFCRYEWITKILSNNLEDAVIVINTGETHSLKCQPVFSEFVASADITEDGQQSKCVNLYEGVITYILVDALLKGGILKQDIGIIAPYRAQTTQLSIILSKMNVDVSTVDQVQGQDKSVIIYSCTKSAADAKISKFNILEDKRRLNVAITRAKHKLIIISNLEVIKKYSTFSKLFECIAPEHFLHLENGKMGFEWEKIVDLTLEK